MPTPSKGEKFCLPSRIVMWFVTVDTLKIFPFIGGWIADRLLGDPEGWPHPIVWFGKLISTGEKRWNQGEDRRQKGAALAIGLIIGVFLVTWGLVGMAYWLHPQVGALITAIGVFYCLSGKSLITEVKAVFDAVERSTEEGRRQVARIVGRDTSNLSPQEIRAAALETLAENLSDGVIAPLFWYLLLGVPGMLTYKMINTLDSMIGYKNERYRLFGFCAAKLDDAANYIPARLTALLMVAVSGHPSLLKFVLRYGSEHASPNSGYPEAALAGILDCRFGGPHNYFGELVYKPFIGSNERTFERRDADVAIRINRYAELLMIIIMVAAVYMSCGYLPLR